MGSSGSSFEYLSDKETVTLYSTLNNGSCAIYDSRTFHCGSANVSEKKRLLLYFSFAAPQSLKKHTAVSWSNVASIREENKAIYTLASFRDAKQGVQAQQLLKTTNFFRKRSQRDN